MDFGLTLMGYHGSWDDAAFAEAHGFSTAGFVDSPLLAGDPFACLALTAPITSTMQLGTQLAIPGTRSPATMAAGIATINRLAPGRTFLGMGAGFTGRAVFGLKSVPAATLREYAQACRGLLDGEEVIHEDGDLQRPIRFRHREGMYVDIEHRIPIYIGADAPRTLGVVGDSGDGWVMSLMFADVMANAADVFGDARAKVQASAREAGRSMDDPYTIWSIGLCVLEPGEPATSARALEQVGAHAMMAFHRYADDPATGEHLPPPIRDRLEVYEREVISRFDVPRDRIYQESHRGHLSHLLDGEAAVLTDELIRMTTLTGTAEEIADVVRSLEAAGLRNVSLCIPPPLTREVVLDVEQKVMPLLEKQRA
jgi:alkanesulfonate monooxygenase SsuD/methylene tetrahydromethanopterin reductase-like flavin-dependent oxidoreductase (luciferase family)